MNRLDTEILAELIDQKHDLLVQVRELGRRQLEFIADDDMNQLLRVLSGKQHLLAGIQSLEQHLTPFRHQDPERRVWQSPAARAKCAERMTGCERLLAEIMQQEKVSEAEMLVRRDAVAAQLQSTHSAAVARGAYVHQTDFYPHSQLDLTSES